MLISVFISERETGLEPATLSLGSWCSTNWATLAWFCKCKKLFWIFYNNRINSRIVNNLLSITTIVHCALWIVNLKLRRFFFLCTSDKFLLSRIQLLPHSNLREWGPTESPPLECRTSRGILYTKYGCVRGGALCRNNDRYSIFEFLSRRQFRAEDVSLQRAIVRETA